VLAIILTARVLGLEIGIARAVGAVVFSVVIGLLMALIFRKEEQQKADAARASPEPGVKRPLWRNAVYFASMVGVLVFANWGKPDATEGVWHAIWSAKWYVASGFSALLAVALVLWFGVKWWHAGLVGVPVALLALLPLVVPALGSPLYVMIPFAAGVIGLSVVANISNDETEEWLGATWGFAKQILPLLLGGVLVAGLFFGSPEGGGLIPKEWVASLVGGNSLAANLFASVAGALMYFATLTEVPILRGLMNSGMGKGPALALLLAGPALSLPNMLVIRSVMGTKKTLVFVVLVVAMATATGVIFGAVAG
jgi:hypothetical protein